MPKYSDDAISRAKTEALEWLEGNADGYPRSWEQERKEDARRGYVLYDEDWEAPPIAAYEVLEREGVVIRIGAVTVKGQERIHFRLTENK